MKFDVNSNIPSSWNDNQPVLFREEIEKKILNEAILKGKNHCVGKHNTLKNGDRIM